ncbi:MAG TPA: molybdate ABC transporter permease subunit, partial [Acidimicrobiales bacterium]
RLVRAVALVPLVLPPVVGGVALLLAFGRRGVAGRALLDAFGVSLPFTTAGAVVAEAFVAMPFFVIAAESAFRAVDTRYEDAARTLGARPASVFARVTLPLAAPGLVAGAVLAWARALGEFGATITFAGNTPGRTATIPLKVYVLIESGRLDGAIALSLVLLGVSVAVLALMRDRWLGSP